MPGYLPRRLYLRQPVGIVAALLEDVLKGLPRAAGDLIGAPIAPSAGYVLRNAGVCLANSIPVSEIPCLQFFLDDTIGHLPAAASGARTRNEAGRTGHILHARLEIETVLVIAIDHDDKMVTIEHRFAASNKTLSQILHMALLAAPAHHTDIELAIGNETRKQLLKKRLHRTLFDEDFKVPRGCHGRAPPLRRAGAPCRVKGSPTPRNPSIHN